VLDELTNEAICAYAAGSEDATELELELAQRLNAALAEIDMLVRDMLVLRAENFRGATDGDDA